MSRRPRRNHSAVFKAKVAIEALADGKTIAEIAQKHDVHPNQVTEWRRQLIERARIDEQMQIKIVELSSRLATTEEKCRMLEKLSDRGWQGWLALIGAGLALLVAFLKR